MSHYAGEYGNFIISEIKMLRSLRTLCIRHPLTQTIKQCPSASSETRPVTSRTMVTSQPVSSSLLERYEATARLPIQYGVPRQTWVENMDTVEEEKLGMIELNPDVFAVYPRIDFIHANMVWQQNYKKVNYNHVKNRYEMVHRYGGGGKPWPQKVGRCFIIVLSHFQFLRSFHLQLTSHV